LRVLQLLLRKWKAEGHKVLIFSKATRMLNIIENFIRREGCAIDKTPIRLPGVCYERSLLTRQQPHRHTYCRLDGATAMKDRQLIVDRFKQSQRDFIFLISTKAGVRLTFLRPALSAHETHSHDLFAESRAQPDGGQHRGGVRPQLVRARAAPPVGGGRARGW
jgi:hypothetical protein